MLRIRRASTSIAIEPAGNWVGADRVVFWRLAKDGGSEKDLGRGLGFGILDLGFWDLVEQHTHATSILV